MQHVVHGLESKEQYIIRGCVAEIWTALTVLHKLVPETQEYSHYWGESFGGGLGALALPWDKRFGSAYLGIPTFGDQARRLKVNCEGSGKALYKRGRYHPELIEVLKYFDASSCAALIDNPLFMNVALFDPAVIPPCQFSVLNAVKAPTKVFIRSAGHFEYPQQEQENKLITHFLKEFFVR